MVNQRFVRGSVLMELVVALGILARTLLPLAFSFVQEQRVLRAQYYRAVAMEIVDGEMELLAGGEWQEFGKGTHDYPVRAEAAESLPAGRFVLTVDEKKVRLEWLPEKRGRAVPVLREITLR